ncbi:MAG: DNA-directed RNA polymerase subunit alpha [Patescibacteria group bacterium]|nr:DNA-directed RNA polymerase subunit alpha [Patescibacteria group bacterium]
MQKIALPSKVEFVKSSDNNRRQINIEPCYPGYGATLGNALRRVLLSSLPGAAPVGVKIKGADHEFMSLPHIKEDVLELILNVKQLRLKMFTDEVVKLELDARGEKKVTAGDIKKNSQVEIVNPELILGTITDMAGKLEMEIFVSKGLGYVTVESRESDKHEIGYIEMDSVFSPILSVGINVENVRVGKMTNWDKLIINLATDGTIAPEDAFKQSVDILINQFSALIGTDKITDAPELSLGETKKAEPETKAEAAEETEAKAETAAEKPKKRGRPKKA